MTQEQQNNALAAAGYMAYRAYCIGCGGVQPDWVALTPEVKRTICGFAEQVVQGKNPSFGREHDEGWTLADRVFVDTIRAVGSSMGVLFEPTHA